MELNTRKDVALLLLDWIRPLKEYYSPGCAQLVVGYSSAHYGEMSARMEGFSRIAWGLGPLFAQKNEELPVTARREIEEWKVILRDGLIHGTDPAHEEYWGNVWDYDQKMVEMAALSIAILLSKDTLWTPLTKVQQQNIFNWLNQVNDHNMPPNNWRFFRILVNMLFRLTGFPENKERLKEDFDLVERCYEGDGWYHDGHPGQKDYYIPYAMHYYGLVYGELMKELEPEYGKLVNERAKEFYRDFLHWFTEEGKEIPFGRSLTYRFAHSAAFSAMAYANVDVPMGELKHMVLGNLRYWNSQPIFDRGGALTIGYQYQNLVMSEHYNAPGSPYWGFKVFLVLALPADHPFWTAEETVPVFEEKRLLTHPNMIAVHEKSGHSLLYVTGQFSHNMGNTIAKYQKFVYSSEFGFSVPRGNYLEDGAFDNTLAGSLAGDDFWRMRRSAKQFEVTADSVRTLYELMPGVEVESVIIPRAKGHIRVHYIKTDKAIELADGGFAIRREDYGKRIDPSMIKEEEKEILCDFPWANAGAVNLSGGGQPKLIIPAPNTNLMYGITAIPTIRFSLEAGEHCLIDYFYGDGEAFSGREEVSAAEVKCGKKWL